MLGRYNRANAGPIQATKSTFIMVCPVYWLSTVCTVAGTNGTRQYNASIGPILVCMLGFFPTHAVGLPSVKPDDQPLSEPAVYCMAQSPNG